MDEEGYLYFVARKDDIIKSRGEKVSPKEVENVLYGLHGVVEAAVIGVPDPILGEAIKAFVVADGDELTEARRAAPLPRQPGGLYGPQVRGEFREELAQDQQSARSKRPSLT